MELLYEQGVSQSEKKKRKRNPDDSITLIDEGKATMRDKSVDTLP